MSAMKNILVEAEIVEEFSRDVAIYDLNQFLNCLSLIPGADVNLEEHAIVITDGTNSISTVTLTPALSTLPLRKSCCFLPKTFPLL